MPVSGLFQEAVNTWCLKTFGRKVARNPRERNYRFLEEALELVQACGMTRGEVEVMVNYVYGRPSGEVKQELGGVMLTLAQLCNVHELDPAFEGQVELERCIKNSFSIREKRAMKSDLPKGVS